MLLNFFGLSYSPNILFFRRLGCTFLFFVSVLFSLFSISTSSALCFLNWSFLIASIKRHVSSIYNPSRILNVRCTKSKNIRLRFIASSSRTSMPYLSLLRSIIYCSNNSSLFANFNAWFTNIKWIRFLRCMSYTFVLLNFRKPVWILNMCNIQKIFYLPSADRMRIFLWQVQHTKHWVIVSVSIYNFNCDKARFSKRGGRVMIKFWKD